MNTQHEHGRNARALEHWHPVLLSSQLRKTPVGVKVMGHQLVVFRTSQGVAAALDDRCPHRGARLSTGHVEADCVVCPYHLWRFNPDGQGHSPVNARMKPFTRAFDVVEHYGIVWLKPRGVNAAMPEIDPLGLYPLGHLSDRIDAPFPIVVDNFTEIEHSPTNHYVFAFDAEGIRHVEPRTEVFDDSIHVTYAGPQRTVPIQWRALASLLGIRAGTRSVIDFRVRFSPIHWIYDLLWEDPATGARLPPRVREFAFLTPLDERRTAVFLLFFSSSRLFAPANPASRLTRRLFLTSVRHEFLLDKRICENVAGMDGSASLAGMQLGKFDHVLRSARRLAQTVYLGERALTPSLDVGSEPP
jgi:phenylpropionate dioxygenase-like ring-hydroxylating dioxygenase large terminal subunit